MSASGTKPDETMPWGNAFAQANTIVGNESVQDVPGMIEIESPKLQAKTLRRAPDIAAYKLYRAAQEWDLIDPILIRDRKDLKSEPKWREHIKPYHHQITNLVTFCRRLPVTLLADDVGLGKTISAGLIASELMSRNRISKILVVCPKLLIPQWKEELESKFGIPGIGATGNELLKAKVPEGGGAVITTYNSARMYLSFLSQAGFEMLILDEAHKLRNLHGTNQCPQVAQRFREALANRTFKYVLMLTATPIQNRLWDIYSLVDLLAVARGHQNPFGSDGVFARTFIADDRTQARRLEPKMRDAFRAIVYGYVSRIRRADANLHFPERVVQLHRVEPLPEEHELIDCIAGPIQGLNRLAQISILQALISSPHALRSQLRKMADNGTAPRALADKVDEIVARIPATAKLQGLGALVDKLRQEQPERWRMGIFTTRRETQTTIEAFLADRGISCGLINGESGARNQQTIAKFKKPVPEIHVIVSTEAGSEGVNLQAANVLVNFDLPWNPMIVEQRIGRIQRLASEHASVCIFNIILRGTFEEYIVGRLMEKLQMAAHAIGDIEALLEAAGLDDKNDEHLAFEELIRRLVIASLAGKNVEETTRLAEQSIAAAKVELENQEKNIDAMLGAMDEAAGEVPYPHLPEVRRSMTAEDFVLATMSSEGTALILESPGIYRSERDGKVDRICFDEANSSNAVLYRSGTGAFTRLVAGITGKGLHNIEDIDDKPRAKAEHMAKQWVDSFGGKFRSAAIEEVKRSFSGTALVKVRATVGHDSYERLVNVPIDLGDAWIAAGVAGTSPFADPLKNPDAVGLSSATVTKKSLEDEGIVEFCRFYIERREQELNASGGDLRKRKKIEGDFTPSLEAHLVGLEGSVRRKIALKSTYVLGTGPEYSSSIEVLPSEDKFTQLPEMLPCSHSETIAPRDCFGRCEVSGSLVLKHLLVKSEVSDRLALPEFIGTCAATGKRTLVDELEESAVSHQKVLRSVLRTSELSGQRAEPQFFGKCEFTGIQALEGELPTSRVSGKKYRKDKQECSVVSGITGYVDEFIRCAETRQLLLLEEAEKCTVSNKLVAPGVLVRCEVSGDKVLPQFLEKSAATGKRALQLYFVASSISGARLLPDEGVKSATGKYCLESEAKVCLWSGKKYHPEDLRTCQLTQVDAYFKFIITNGGKTRLQPLFDLLNGIRRTTDRQDLWPSISALASRTVEARSEVEAAILSPNGDYLAVCLEAKNWLGLRTRQSGLLYAIRDGEAVGRIVLGKRGDQGWIPQITI
ncbi:MAG TPA: SNF2-related protein [Terriglobales bacterium]|nr:SNF2-related protein [Terriglobales bacterium]